MTFGAPPEISAVANSDQNASEEPDNDNRNAGSGWQKQDFTVKSQYFSVMIRVQYASTDPNNPTDLVLESIIRRDLTPETGFVGVIYRDFSRNLDDIARLKNSRLLTMTTIVSQLAQFEPNQTRYADRNQKHLGI